jgi:hypothetical protein
MANSLLGSFNFVDHFLDDSSLQVPAEFIHLPLGEWMARGVFIYELCNIRIGVVLVFFKLRGKILYAYQAKGCHESFFVRGQTIGKCAVDVKYYVVIVGI